MRRGILRNLLAFVVALVVTVGVVTVLSAATQIGPDAAAQYSREVRREETRVEALSAPVHTHESVSFLEAAGGFLLIIVISGGGSMLLLRSMRRGRAVHTGQAYKPRNDMAHFVRKV